MRKTKLHCVATIAGTDPSGGAGIQADIKAISATGCYAASIITALVAQNTQGVQAIHSVPPDFINLQMESVLSDLTVSAVKIGMLHNEKIIEVVASALEKFKFSHVILDPVMVAKNGCQLLNPDAVDCLKQRLFPCVSLITPNTQEAEKLLGVAIKTESDMQLAAEKIGDEFHVDVLIKGGHLTSLQASDVLYQPLAKTWHWFHSERINTKNTHGTGCSLSSAIASYLAQGYPLTGAIHAAKHYLTKAIQSGRNLQIGHGNGPVDHFYFMETIARELCADA